MCSTIAGASIESHHRKQGRLELPRWVQALLDEFVGAEEEWGHFHLGSFVESKSAGSIQVTERLTKRGLGGMPHKLKYWLMKSEPSVFSIDDLAKSPMQTTCWDGVRNYQARNFMKNMAVGEQVLFYHSNADPPAVVGIAEVVKAAYADPTQFDKKNKHYDPGSDPSNPRWEMVDIKYLRKFSRPMTLDQLRKEISLKRMVLLQKGSRLSVQPVSPLEWRHILSLV